MQLICTSHKPFSCRARKPLNVDNLHMDPATHKRDVGSRLRIAIQALGLSQAEVARQLDMSPSKLGNWLRGDDYPNEWKLYLFCTRHNVSADWIYRGQVAAAMAKPLADSLWEAGQASPEEQREQLAPEIGRRRRLSKAAAS